MTKRFISDISGKEFPAAECIHAKTVAHSIMKIIKLEHPHLRANSRISRKELNAYRQKYIEAYLLNDEEQLSPREKQLMKEIKRKQLITEQLDEEHDNSLTFGQRLADKVATFGGSWRFIIIFGMFLAVWMTINTLILGSKAYDPFPFILLNLILSTIAALQAPVIMMSQNRQEEKDRENSKKDYMINLTSELEIRMLHEKIDQMILHQQEELVEIQQIQMDMMREILEKIEKKS